MAVIDTINSIKGHIEEAYGMAEEKGATLPGNKNLENLPDTISSISGGGQIELNTFDDVINMVFPNKVDEVNEMLDRKSNEAKNSLYNEPITLYTPSAKCTHYCIRKRYDNSTYAVVWTRHYFVEYDTQQFHATPIQLRTGTQGAYPTFDYFGQSYSFTRKFADNPSEFSSNFESYFSTSFNTIEEALAHIQNPNATYTKSSTLGFNCQRYSADKYFCYSNSAFFTKNGSTYNIDYSGTRISSNEIIKVIGE